MGQTEDYINEILKEIEMKEAARANERLKKFFIQAEPNEDGPKTIFIPARNNEIIYNFGNKNSSSAGASSSSGGSECAGTYPVSGYTRADGTEVSDYMRTCGAAHAGSSESEKESSEDIKDKELETEQEDNDWDYVDPDEFDEYLDKQMLEDYKRYKEQKNKVLTGHVSETETVSSDESKESSEQAKRTVSGSGKSSIKLEGQAKTSRIEQMVKRFLRKHSKTYRDYDRLTVEEVRQKALTKNFLFNPVLPLKDYYKISLDLSDNPEKVVSNERNKIYKADNLPRNIDKKVVLDKIAQSLKLDLSNSKDLAIAKNTVVVAPTPESKLVKVIKRSRKINDFIKNNYDNIKKGAFEGKTVSIEFERPTNLPKGLIYQNVRDNTTLYGVLHRADICNVEENADKSISLVIRDFFDFEYWPILANDGEYEQNIKNINNNAYEQQKAGKLTPYLLYIEINISKDELDKMFAQEL